MIDALFGSKTRVKLLHLFLNNPGKSFYVREITRLIDEQINSVRRELSNMLEVGVITSDSANNKLYYQVNQHYQYYGAFRAIFADEVSVQVDEAKAVTISQDSTAWQGSIAKLPGVRLAVIAGTLVKGSASPVDLLLVGKVPAVKLRNVIKQMEKTEGREINYSVLPYEDFYYRLSVRDRFISEIITGRHVVLSDPDNILK